MDLNQEHIHKKVTLILIFIFIILGIITLISATHVAYADSGTYGTNPAPINSFTQTDRYFSSTVLGQEIATTTNELISDENGDIIINSIQLYVINESGSEVEYSIVKGPGTIGTGTICNTETISNGFEGFFTWDDCGTLFDGSTPFDLFDNISFRLQTFISDDEISLGGFNFNTWNGGNCITITNCGDVTNDIYFKINFETFGGFNFDAFEEDELNLTGDLYDSYIEIVEPSQGSTTASNIINFEGNLFISDDELDTIPATTLKVVGRTVPYAGIANFTTFDIDTGIDADTIAGNIYNFATTTTIADFEGLHGLEFRLVPEINENILILEDTGTFYVATTTTILPRTELPINPDAICDGYSFPVNKICEVLVFLFVPSTSFTEQLEIVKNNLSNRIPFGFYFVIKEKLETIENNTGSMLNDVTVDLTDGSLGEITIINWSGIQTTFNEMGFNDPQVIVILQSILWLIFSLFIFYKVLGIFSS